MTTSDERVYNGFAYFREWTMREIVAGDSYNLCLTVMDGLKCTREAEHSGLHAAHGSSSLFPILVWSST